RRQSRSSLFPYTTLFRSVINPAALGYHASLIGDDGILITCTQGRCTRTGVALTPLGAGSKRRGAPTHIEQLAGDGDIQHAQLVADRKSTRLNSSHVKISY